MGRRNTMGLTRRDVSRIKALAESVTDEVTPAALADLDAPWRVGAYRAGDRYRGNGEPFGEWAGCVLVAWWRPPAGLSAEEHLEGERAALQAVRLTRMR